MKATAALSRRVLGAPNLSEPGRPVTLQKTQVNRRRAKKPLEKGALAVDEANALPGFQAESETLREWPKDRRKKHEA
jgi:hypothetical protein